MNAASFSASRTPLSSSSGSSMERKAFDELRTVLPCLPTMPMSSRAIGSLPQFSWRFGVRSGRATRLRRGRFRLLGVVDRFGNDLLRNVGIQLHLVHLVEVVGLSRNSTRRHHLCSLGRRHVFYVRGERHFGRRGWGRVFGGEFLLDRFMLSTM